MVAGELGQDLAEMPLAEDKDMVQALAAERAHEPLSNEFARTVNARTMPDCGPDAAGVTDRIHRLSGSLGAFSGYP